MCHHMPHPTLSTEVDCTNWTCANGYIKCPIDGWCLHPSKVCDGKEDCAGGSDESGESFEIFKNQTFCLF